jgi:hypothetical protein
MPVMRRLLYLLSGLFLCVSAMAQGVIKGQVTSKADNKPLSNVTVSVKGTNRSTETDQNGNFSIEATKGETLLITSVGFTAVEVKVGSGNVNVSLEIGESRLDEVVVTAMGIKKERKALGYSVTELNAEELMKNKNTNVVNSLTGKVPGVNVTQFSGAPGAGASITIRGATSTSETRQNQPLFVVDGIIYDNSTTVTGNTGTDGLSRS